MDWSLLETADGRIAEGLSKMNHLPQYERFIPPRQIINATPNHGSDGTYRNTLAPQMQPTDFYSPNSTTERPMLSPPNNDKDVIAPVTQGESENIPNKTTRSQLEPTKLTFVKESNLHSGYSNKEKTEKANNNEAEAGNKVSPENFFIETIRKCEKSEKKRIFSIFRNGLENEQQRKNFKSIQELLDYSDSEEEEEGVVKTVRERLKTRCQERKPEIQSSVVIEKKKRKPNSYPVTSTPSAVKEQQQLANINETTKKTNDVLPQKRKNELAIQKKNEDKNENINCYLDQQEEPKCEMCTFRGKSIIQHYKSAHLSDEVVIVRVSTDNSKGAIDERIEEKYEDVILEVSDRKVPGKKLTFTHQCRAAEEEQEDVKDGDPIPTPTLKNAGADKAVNTEATSKPASLLTDSNIKSAVIDFTDEDHKIPAASTSNKRQTVPVTSVKTDNVVTNVTSPDNNNMVAAVRPSNKPVLPKPHVSITHCSTGVSIKCMMPYNLENYEAMARYELYMCKEETKMWHKAGQIEALLLPTKATLVLFTGGRYWFKLRAVDVLNRLGSFSDVCVLSV